MIKWTLLVNTRTHAFRLRVGIWAIPDDNEVVLLHGTWTALELRDWMFSKSVGVWFSAQHSVYYLSHNRTNPRHDHVIDIPRAAVSWRG